MRCVVPAVDSAAGHAPAARLVPILSLPPQHAAVGRSVARAGRGCIQHRPPTPKGVHLWFRKPDVCGVKRPAARTAATQPGLGLHKQSPIFSEGGVLRSIPWWGVLGQDMGGKEEARDLLCQPTSSPSPPAIITQYTAPILSPYGNLA